jgi:hypothetical protein
MNHFFRIAALDMIGIYYLWEIGMPGWKGGSNEWIITQRGQIYFGL